MLPGNKEDLYLEVNKNSGCGCEDWLRIQVEKQTVRCKAISKDKVATKRQWHEGYEHKPYGEDLQLRPDYSPTNPPQTLVSPLRWDDKNS